MQNKTATFSLLSRLPTTFCFLLAGAITITGTWSHADDETSKEGAFAKFIDDEDGMFDMSDYLATSTGFLAVPIIITEPAVGYGLGITAVFLQPREAAGEEGWARPNISGVMGFKTENDTNGFGGFDSRYWMDGKVRSKAFALSSTAYLDFYDLGDKFRYSLDMKGGVLGFEWFTPLDKISLEFGFNYFDIEASLDGAAPAQNLEISNTTKFSSISAAFKFDSRDNPFTPSKGYFAKTNLTLNAEDLGATEDFQKLNQVLIGFWSLGEKFVLGVKLEGEAIFGDYPFYAKPFVKLRGVPAVRYQGEEVLFGEAELQYILTDRWRILGFAGTGKAWDDLPTGAYDQSVVSGGAGFRYRIARKFGMDMGLDLAFSEEETVFYITFGSAWTRL